MGLLDSIVEATKNQYAKGEPYRNAIGGLLQGDLNKVGRELSKSDLTPTDFAMTFAPLGIMKVNKGNMFQELAKTGKLQQAKSKQQELDDLTSGKSKFAEVRLNWDDPNTYDLADNLKMQGFDSTVTQQGADMITLFHKPNANLTPVLSAKNPYDFGKAYGYKDNDIAAFYVNKYGNEAEKYWKQDTKAKK